MSIGVKMPVSPGDRPTTAADGATVVP